MVFVSWNLYWWEDRANKKNINCSECWPSVAVIKRRQPGRRKHTCKGPEEGNCQTKKRLTAMPALPLDHSSPPTTRLLGGAAAGVHSLPGTVFLCPLWTGNHCQDFNTKITPKSTFVLLLHSATWIPQRHLQYKILKNELGRSTPLPNLPTLGKKI